MECASYHTGVAHARVFGSFWPDRTLTASTVTLAGERLARKHRAMAAHASQAHILRKFPVVTEQYRPAPTYNFHRPPPPIYLRWDLQQRRPSTHEWRTLVAAIDRARA